jgi:hypothetical protein
MFEIKIQWKSFKINLNRLGVVIKSISESSYCGMSANEQLVLHFESKPSLECENRITMHINSLTSETEAAKFKQDSDEDKAVEFAKANILYSDLESLIPAERKLLMGLLLTKEDKASILAKYPQ